jgi:hypothetical protein
VITDDDLEIPTDTYPLAHDLIEQEQRRDEYLQNDLDKRPENYRQEEFKRAEHTYTLLTKDAI